MAEAVGLAASVMTLVSVAYKSCKSLIDTITRLDDAPKHVHAIANDLEDFYHLLGTLQAVLDEEDSAAGIIEPAMSGHLSQALKHCLEVLKTTNLIIAEYDDRDRSIVGLHLWKRVKWTFKEKEIDDVRKELAQCKMTLNMAVSVANWYNVRSSIAIASQVDRNTSNMEAAMGVIKQEVADVVQELEMKLPNIMDDLEDLKATQGMQPAEHDARDRSLVEEDLHFTLRQYLEDDQSMCSSPSGRGTPSILVSSLGASGSDHTSIYRTAQTHLYSEAGTLEALGGYMALYVNVMGKTVPLHIRPNASMSQLKSLVNSKINLPNTELDLIHEGHEITGKRAAVSKDETVRKAGILPNGRLRCALRHKRSLTPDNDDCAVL